MSAMNAVMRSGGSVREDEKPGSRSGSFTAAGGANGHAPPAAGKGLLGFVGACIPHTCISWAHEAAAPAERADRTGFVPGLLLQHRLPLAVGAQLLQIVSAPKSFTFDRHELRSLCCHRQAGEWTWRHGSVRRCRLRRRPHAPPPWRHWGARSQTPRSWLPLRHLPRRKMCVAPRRPLLPLLLYAS